MKDERDYCECPVHPSGDCDSRQSRYASFNADDETAKIFGLFFWAAIINILSICLLAIFKSPGLALIAGIITAFSIRRKIFGTGLGLKICKRDAQDVEVLMLTSILPSLGIVYLLLTPIGWGFAAAILMTANDTNGVLGIFSCAWFAISVLYAGISISDQ